MKKKIINLMIRLLGLVVASLGIAIYRYVPENNNLFFFILWFPISFGFGVWHMRWGKCEGN